MRVFIILCLLLCNMYAAACLCVNDINKGFSELEQYIVDDMVNPHKDNVDSLKGTIQDNIDDVESQNKELQKLINVEKEKALQYEQMIFLLLQRKKMLE